MITTIRSKTIDRRQNGMHFATRLFELPRSLDPTRHRTESHRPIIHLYNFPTSPKKRLDDTHERVEHRCPKFANSSTHHLPPHHAKANTTPSLHLSPPHLNPPQAFASKQRSAAYIAVLNQTRTREGASSGFCGGFKRRRAKTGNRPAVRSGRYEASPKLGGMG